MSKITYNGTKITIDFDLTDSNDILKKAKKDNKGKTKDTLTDKEKSNLFDIFYNAGVIIL